MSGVPESTSVVNADQERTKLDLDTSGTHDKETEVDRNGNVRKENAASRNQDGQRQDEDDDDPEIRELSKLRCPSTRTEDVSTKTNRRKKNRCADYPGLAFGSAMFGSDTMMKFNIIKNELHNIMRSQLKRVDGEVQAMTQRIRDLDNDLEKSEKYIKTATGALAETWERYQEEQKEHSHDNEEDDALSQFDAQLKLLEGKLLQAKALAHEHE